MVEVSVVIPTYNRSNVISRAIESVLNQTLDDFELIVVDDGSTDNTIDILNEYRDSRINVLTHSTNRGGAAARNTGIEESSGDYIAFLDSDDEWDPMKLDKQVNYLKSLSDDWVANYCSTHHIPNDNSPRFESEFIDVFRGFLEPLEEDQNIPKEGGEELIPHLLSGDFDIDGASTLLVDRTYVDRVDGFDERFPRHQDWEFLIRLLKLGKLSHMDDRLVTKHGWADPDMKTIVESKKLYVRKFSEDIHRYEQEGYDIIAKHNYELSILYLKNGDVEKFVKSLSRSNVAGEDLLEILIAAYVGTRRTLAPQ